MTIERPCYRHGICHFGKKGLVGRFGDGTSLAVTAEIRNLDPLLATSRLNGCDILITPTPELNMRKS